jgi:hypothetical protein
MQRNKAPYLRTTCYATAPQGAAMVSTDHFRHELLAQMDLAATVLKVCRHDVHSGSHLGPETPMIS